MSHVPVRRIKQNDMPHSLPAPSERQILFFDSKVNCFLSVDLAGFICKPSVIRMLGTCLHNIYLVIPLLTSSIRSRLCHMVAEWFPPFSYHNIPRLIGLETKRSLGIISFLTVANSRENSESELGHLLPV